MDIISTITHAGSDPKSFLVLSGASALIIGALCGMSFKVYKHAMMKFKPVSYLESLSDKLDDKIYVLDSYIEKLKKNPVTLEIGKDLDKQLLDLVSHKIENLQKIKDALIKTL